MRAGSKGLPSVPYSGGKHCLPVPLGIVAAHSQSARMRVPAPRWPPRSECDYFPVCQSCLDAAINEAQSSDGFPRVSIQANTLHGSVPLLDEGSVDLSLTHE